MVNFTSNTYQMNSGRCLLTGMVDRSHEPSKKIKIWCPDRPVIHINDSDVVKPDGYKFESLGWGRGGSESTVTKNVYQKGNFCDEPWL